MTSSQASNSLRSVAIIQDAPVAFDTAATLQRAVEAIHAARGAQLIVFPEAFIGGYPKGIDFGARVGMRSPEGREWFRRYSAGAISVPGKETERLATAARDAGAVVVIGVIERLGKTLYCSALTFGEDGRLLANHRKTMPTAIERLIWGQGDGSTLGPVNTSVGVVGTAICWENYMPQLRLALYAGGVQLYCAPTVDDRDSWIPTVRHIAMEGRCFVLSACQFARRSDYPADYAPVQGDDPATVLIRGGSCIVDPLGNLLAGPLYHEAAILRAELDLQAIDRAALDLDVVGHYARPDLFQLRVNRQPQIAVSNQPIA